MNRRRMLGSLLGAVCAVALDPEKLLWVPGSKMISIPRPQILCVGDKITIAGLEGQFKVLRHFEGGALARLDILYGFPQFAESHGVRIVG